VALYAAKDLLQMVEGNLVAGLQLDEAVGSRLEVLARGQMRVLALVVIAAFLLQ